jgi:2-keto-3-deoxy-6-phosphogluconate aldolase
MISDDVGSIIDPTTTTKYILAGARFRVSPAMIPEMAAICSQENIS